MLKNDKKKCLDEIVKERTPQEKMIQPGRLMMNSLIEGTSENPIVTMQLVFKELCEENFLPENGDFHFMVSLLSDDKWNEVPLIDTIRHFASLIIQWMCKFDTKFIHLGVDFGLVEAGLKHFPRYDIAWILALLVEQSFKATGMLINAGVVPMLLSAFTSEEVDSRTIIGFLKLAGFMCEYSTHCEHMIPLIATITDKILSSSDTDVITQAFGALSEMVYRSELICSHLVSLPQFPEILSRIELYATQDEHVCASFCSLMGAVLHYPGVFNLEHAQVVITLFARALQSVVNGYNRRLVVEAIRDGCENGPVYTQCCAEAGLVTILLDEYGKDSKMSYKSSVVSTLCKLFEYSAPELQMMIGDAGLFSLLAEQGTSFVDDAGLEIAEALLALLQTALDTGNEALIEYMHDLPIEELISALSDSPDADVRAITDEIHEQI